jgi:hypothetical protein
MKEAEKIAHALLQGYCGPNHKIIDMKGFYGALVQALQAAHAQGWKDRAEATEH